MMDYQTPLQLDVASIRSTQHRSGCRFPSSSSRLNRHHGWNVIFPECRPNGPTTEPTFDTTNIVIESYPSCANRADQPEATRLYNNSWSNSFNNLTFSNILSRLYCSFYKRKSTLCKNVITRTK